MYILCIELRHESVQTKGKSVLVKHMSELCIRMVMNFTLSSFYAPGWRLNIDSLGWLSYFAQRIQGFTETFTYSCRIMSKFCICIHGFFNNLP